MEITFTHTTFPAQTLQASGLACIYRTRWMIAVTGNVRALDGRRAD